MRPTPLAHAPRPTPAAGGLWSPSAAAAAPTSTSASARTLALLGLALALIAFLGLGAYQLHEPGLHYDEAKEGGLNAMQLLTGQPVTAFRDAVVQIGRLRLPLMVQDYIGALNPLLAVPLLALARGDGTDPDRAIVALRLLPLLIGAVTILLTWLLAYRLGGALPPRHRPSALGQPGVRLLEPAGHLRHQPDRALLHGRPVDRGALVAGGQTARPLAVCALLRAGPVCQAAVCLGHRCDAGAGGRRYGWPAAARLVAQTRRAGFRRGVLWPVAVLAFAAPAAAALCCSTCRPGAP